jgi:hypothetical protein
MAWASALMLASAGLILLLGVIHLAYTFHGPKLLPRDRSLVAQMRAATLVITPHTDLWRAWIGFNASHSLGAMLFGLLFGWLALRQPALLFGSPFLCGLALAFLAAWLWLAARYWFRLPLAGIAVATACALAAMLAAQSG